MQHKLQEAVIHSEFRTDKAVLGTPLHIVTNNAPKLF